MEYSMERLSDTIKERVKTVDFEIKRILLDENPFLLPDKWYRDDPIVQSLWAGGKRIRPLLCLFSCESVGGDWRSALPTAAGVEFLHTFTLVHDDIMDRSDLRRGRPSLHSIWGEPIAITAGDALYSLAFKAFLRNAEIPRVTYEQVNRVIDLAIKKCISLARGQTMDILFERMDVEKVSMEDYLDMAKMKTSSLIELSLMAGAIIGGAEKSEIDALERFGRNLGLAFQIQDDILDIEGGDTGKPKTLDIERGKKTFLILHAIENADDNEREEIIKLIRNGKENKERILRILRDTGSIEFARQKVADLLNDAKKQLSVLGENDGKRHLEGMIRYLLERKR